MSVRVYALSKQLNVDPKKILDAIEQLGINGRNSSLRLLSEEEVQRVKVWLQSPEQPKITERPPERTTERPKTPHSSGSGRSSFLEKTKLDCKKIQDQFEEKQEIKRLKKEKEEDRMEKEQMSKRLDEIQNKIPSLQKESETLCAEIRRIEDEAKEPKSRLKEVKEQISSLCIERDALKKELGHETEDQHQARLEQAKERISQGYRV